MKGKGRPIFGLPPGNQPMRTQTKHTPDQQHTAQEYLKTLLPIGSVVYALTSHVSANGTVRRYRYFIGMQNGKPGSIVQGEPARCEIKDITAHLATATDQALCDVNGKQEIRCYESGTPVERLSTTLYGTYNQIKRLFL